jgi:predicted SnoaL-like aldol condensation-catalyzing enzyme
VSICGGGEGFMSLEKNKALVRRGIEALNKKDLTVIEELIAPDYVDHTNFLQSGEDIKKFYTEVFKTTPDFHRTIEDMAAEGDKVWARFKMTATSPTGKKLELSVVTIYRITDGKLVESWSVPQTVTKKKKPKFR